MTTVHLTDGRTRIRGTVDLPSGWACLTEYETSYNGGEWTAAPADDRLFLPAHRILQITETIS